MEKIRDHQDYDRWQKNRGRKELRQRQTRPARLRSRRMKLEASRRLHEQQVRSAARPVELSAPKRFSLIENPTEVLRFFAEIRSSLSRGQAVVINIDDIQELTIDTLALMLAHTSDPRFTSGTAVYGTIPKRPDLAAQLAQSGFYDHVEMFGDKKKPGVRDGLIRTRQQNKVDTQIARDVVHFASKTCHGTIKKNPGVYRTIIECMANTQNHARGSSRRVESWWLAVGRIGDSRKVSFAFVDVGVGLFNSVKMRNLKRSLLRSIGMLENTYILKDIIHGRMHSRTNLKYRGKGFPAIYQAAERGQIHQLRIIANDAYADLHLDRFETLNTPLRGTFLYWEMWPDS